MTDRGPYSFDDSVFTPTFPNPENTLLSQNTDLTLKDSVQLTHSTYTGHPTLPSNTDPHEEYNDDLAVKPMKKVKATQSNINMLDTSSDMPGPRLNRNKMLNLGLKVHNNDAQDPEQKQVKFEESTLLTPVPYSSFSKASTNYFSEAAETPGRLNQISCRTQNVDEDQQEIMQVAMERKAYADLFSEMHDNLMIAFQRQLEFINLLKEMNNPEKAQYWPVLDKINPLIAGVMMRKTKIDENTLVVMKRTHNLMKAGPTQRTLQSDRKSFDYTKQEDGKVDDMNPPIKNGKRDFIEYERSLNQIRKKENEADISQIMSFILQDSGSGNVKEEFKEGQKKEES